MANWSDLKAAVASIVKTNGNKEITGQLLQNVLNNIISNVGLNSTFAGIATPETNPGTPDGNVFYLATTAGTYSNFNGIIIEAGEAVILEWKGSWVKKDSGFVTKEKLSELEENTNQKLAELGSQGGYSLMTETERLDGYALKKEGQVETSQYVVVGTVFTYPIKRDRVYQIEVYAPGFYNDHAVACLYKNGEFVKCIAKCDGTVHKEHLTIDTQYIDADTIKVCSYNKQGRLDDFYVWESAEVTRENITISIDEVNGFEPYKDIIENVPLIEEGTKKAADYIESLQRTEETLNIEYQTNRLMAFDNVEVGSIISFRAETYRHIISADISGLSGIIYVDNILSSGDLIGIAITDKNGVVLTTANVNTTNSYRNAFVNLSAYPTAEKLYSIVSNNTSAPKSTITLLVKNSIISKRNDVFLAMNSINGCSSELIYKVYSTHSLEVAELNQKYQFIVDIYRGTFVVPVSNIIGCSIKLEKVNPSNGQAVLIVNKNDEVIGIIQGNKDEYNTVTVDLSKYIDAEYILFASSPSEPHYPIITLIEKSNIDSISKDVEGVENNVLEYSSIKGTQPMSDLNIGDLFDTQTSNYRSVAVAVVKGLRGNVRITNILGGNGKDVFIVDSEDKIIDILSGSLSQSYVHEVIVNLEQYNGIAKKIYIQAAPVGATNYNQPVITNWYDGLKKRVSDLEGIMPKGGVVILHFDVNPYTNKKAFDILAEYGFPASWALEDSAFGDGADNTFSTWRSEEYKKAFWDALKRGDDVGIYPSLIASQYDEQGWKNWLDTALNNLSNHEIYNISTFFCGRLDINDDLLNAVKSRGFKFIRGGGSNDSASVDTYPYTDENKFMPIKATDKNFFVNSTFFIATATDVERFKSYVNKAIDNNSAISVFTHSVEEVESSSSNITEEKFRAILDFFKEKVDEGKLQLMTWREYYRCINRLKGEEWDYNRLLKMSMTK